MIVLDSSAVLAVILGEPGADRVRMAFSQGVISTACLAEILTKVTQRGRDLEGSYVKVGQFGLGVHLVEERHALIAADIAMKAPRALGLSLGDRLCIALAMALNCELLTGDRRMAQFDAGVPITLFR